MPKKLLLSLDKPLADALAERKVETGTPTTEFIRRAIRLALYADGIEQRNRPRACA
jgi:hypothetical protein